MSSASFRGDGASVGFAEAVRRGLGRSTIYGRASRSEFWYFWLFCVLVNIASAIVFVALLDLTSVDRLVGVMVSLFQTVVFIRRLHDVDRSGWWILLTFTIVGIIPLFIWAVRKGDPRRNRFDVASRYAPEPVGVSTLAIDRIERLAQLRRDGAITEDEYQALKKTAL